MCGNKMPLTTQKRYFARLLCFGLLIGISLFNPDEPSANPQMAAESVQRTAIANQSLPQSDVTVEQVKRAATGNFQQAKEVDQRAQDFVASANELIKQRAMLDSELNLAIKALSTACLGKHDLSLANQRPIQTADKVQEAEAWAMRLNAQLTSLTSLKNQIATETKNRCQASLRAPGFRSERCIILEVGERWAQRTEQFIKLQQTATTADMTSLTQASALESFNCHAKENPLEITARVVRIHRMLKQKAQLLISDSIQELGLLAGTNR